MSGETPGGQQPSEEELRAQLEDEIRKVRVEDVVLQSVVSILNLSARRIAKRMPKARLVKAFNTIYWKALDTDSRPSAPLDDRLAIFLAGDDPQAKAVVSKLIEEIGFAPIDTGSLREGGRRQEPGSPTYGRPMTAREARNILR